MIIGMTVQGVRVLSAPWGGGFEQWFFVFWFVLIVAPILIGLFCLWRLGPEGLKEAQTKMAARRAPSYGARIGNIALYMLVGALVFLVVNYFKSQ